MTKAIVEVSIALLFHRTQVLVGWREAKQHQGNKYEFPGGKVEQGETPEQACRREVLEEVGIVLEQLHQFDVIRHEYDDIHVHLHLFQAYISDAQISKINAPWAWYRREQLSELPFPKANDAIIQRLQWPHQIKISEQIQQIKALSPDQMLYLRINTLSAQDMNIINALSEVERQKLIINVQIWQSLSADVKRNIGAVHFKTAQLLDESMLEEQHQALVGVRTLAACHDQTTVTLAHKHGFDAVLLSPVLHTPTHKDTKALGWDHFGKIAKNSHVPVFALGGMKPEDLDLAQKYAGYGVAGIRHF